MNLIYISFTMTMIFSIVEESFVSSMYNRYLSSSSSLMRSVLASATSCDLTTTTISIHCVVFVLRCSLRPSSFRLSRRVMDDDDDDDDR